MELEYVLPNQVLASVDYAKKNDPKDKFGDKAFRINNDNVRANKDGDVGYCNFEVLKFKNGKWEYVPCNLRFMNMTTKAKILPPTHEKRKNVKTMALTFMSDSTFNATDNKGKAYVEEYGKAKSAIYDAFARLARAAIKAGKLKADNPKISTNSAHQTVMKDKNNNNAIKTLDKSIDRVEIPFKKERDLPIKKDEPPMIKIFDVEKKLNPNTQEARENGLPYKIATIDKDSKEIPLVYENICEFITYGSSVSGLDKMNSVSISNLGVSLPSKAAFLIVKKNKVVGINISNVFSLSEIESMASAETTAPLPEEEDLNNYGDNDNETIPKLSISKDIYDTINSKDSANTKNESAIEDQELELSDDDFDQ